jgi:hypothetical protein
MATIQWWRVGSNLSGCCRVSFECGKGNDTHVNVGGCRYARNPPDSKLWSQQQDDLPGSS